MLNTFLACAEVEFTCETAKQCIDMNQVCNQILDCQDGSDEKNCACQELTQWTCQDGTCLDKEQRCDGESQVLQSLIIVHSVFTFFQIVP